MKYMKTISIEFDVTEHVEIGMNISQVLIQIPESRFFTF